MWKNSRSRQRRRWNGRITPELLHSLEASGEKFRVNIAWNNSFHDAQYYPVLLAGPAVRKPMTARECVALLAASDRIVCAAWRAIDGENRDRQDIHAIIRLRLG